MVALCAAPAHAQQPFSTEIARGLAWLQSQVQADGSLANEAASLATDLQNRSEAVQTLASLANVPPALANAVAADTDGNTEYLARQALALTAAGRDASAPLNLLLLRRNADRGFGGGPGFESNPLDTAWTVLALARAGQGAGALARDARAYLMASMQADGGVTAPSDLVRVEYSALALFALQTAGDGSTATSVRTLTSWLLQRQAADGSWQGDLHLTALALIAVAPVLSDPALRAAAAAYLAGRQSAAGSWQDDPFLTALALRALGASSASPAAATLAGQVVDQSTNLPLAGASIALTGAGTGGAATDSDGRFSISGLAAGTYAAQITRSGYGSASASYTLIAGQAFDAGRIPLPQTATTGIVRGHVRAASTGTPLAGVLMSIAGSATLSATTDAAGAFEFSAVPPGAVTISASLSGYQSASAAATLAGGVTLDFSPGLYTESETAPTTGRFFGRTVIAATGAPLSGVTILLNGVVAGTTGGDGSFDLTLSPETYSAVYTLSGYDSVSQGFVMVAGANVEAGTLALTAQRTTTTLSGRVTDVDGLPLAGATVQLVGGAAVTAGADGAYSLANLEGTSFDVRASATGYASQLVTLQVARPSDLVHSFALASASTSLEIGALAAVPANAGANVEVSVATTITNTGATDASALLQAQVIDVDGAGGVPGAVIGAGVVYDAGGGLLGIVSLAPGAAQAVRVTWNTGRFPPGRYAVVLRLVARESVTSATPQGSLLLEKGASVDLSASRHFAGSATANPPVLRAGTGTAVRLSALIQNDGNVQLPPRGYTLNVVNTQTNAIAHTQSANVQALAVSELAEVAFSDWTPTQAGNFRVEIGSADPAEGKIATPLYVGDAGSAQYTANKLVVPAGTQTVRAKVRVTGQDVAGGTISDPLAAPIKNAIQRAVTFADNFGSSHYVNDLKCYGCHNQAQSVLGGELSRRLATNDENKRRILVNGINTLQKADGSWHTDGFKVATMLALWALTGWRNPDQFSWTKSRSADYLLATQSGNGSWTSDHTHTSWWRSTAPVTGVTARTLVDLRKYLAKQPAPSVTRYSAVDWPRGAAATGQWIALTEAPDGAIYAARYNEARVDRILDDGTLQPVHAGINVRDSLVTADGTLYMSAEQGVYRKAPDGTLTQLTNKRASGLARADDGSLYFAAYAERAVYRITPAGALVRMAPSAPLATPVGVALDTDGSLIVADQGLHFVYRFRPDGSFTRLTEIFTAPGSSGTQPVKLQRWGDKWLVGGENALYVFDSEWYGERALYEKAYGLLPTSAGEVLFGGNGRIRRLNVSQENVAAKVAAIDAAIERATNWLLLDGQIDNNDNIQLAGRMIGLGGVLEHYSGTARESSIRAKLEQVGATLRSRQRSNGGWSWFGVSGTVDSLVTAMAGVALDYLNPSPQSAEVRNAVTLLLSRQRPDGSWLNEDLGISRGVIVPLLATTWVEIWLPTMLERLGGIDTDLSVTFPANVTMSNPDRAPSSSSINPDGSSTYVWKLVGVTAEGQEVNYDLTLAGMAVNEVRAVSSDAHLTFKNSFTAGNVDAPVDIPRVTASAFLDLGVTTDRTLYGANGTVSITGQVTNTAVGLSSGSVSFEIRAPDDGPVAQLGTLPFGGLAPGGSTNLTPTWNTDGTLAGPGFYVLATLYDSEGRFVGTARSSFAIVGSESGALAAARISTDKPAYLPSDTAQVLSRAANLTLNQPLDNVTLVTTVLNADGSVRFTRSELIPQLVQNALRDFAYAVPIAFAPPGAYSGTVVLRDAGGTVLSSNTTSFTVQSTAATGSGLTGTLSATPKEVPLGDAAALAFTATNQGNGALAGLPLTLSVVDPAAEQVLAQFPETVELTAGATHQMARSWTPSGPVGATYVAVLSAVVGGNTLTLAQDSFKVVAPPVQLDVALSNARQARVLVLLSCKYGSDEREQSGPAQQACIDQRRNFLGAYFTGLGIQHLITTTEEAFRLAFRSGAYNTYWVTGGGLKLANTLTEEVREQVFRGDAIIRDGVHDERHLYFDAEAGITLQGKLDPVDQAITLHDTLFAPGTLPSVGRPLKLGITTGQVQAVFPASADSPAIVSNQYGLGRGVLFGYDLIGTAMAQPSGALDQLVLSALGWVAPQPASPAIPRSLALLRTHIANVGQAADLRVTLSPPAGANVVATAPAATPDAESRPVWTFTLDSGATQDLDASVRLPEAEGSHTATVAIDSIRNDITTPYGTFDLAFGVETAATIAPRVAADLTALVIPLSSEQNDRDIAVSSIQAAESALSSGAYETAIAQLVNAAERLLRITSADVAPHRVEVGRIMQEAHIRWAATQP